MNRKGISIVLNILQSKNQALKCFLFVNLSHFGLLIASFSSFFFLIASFSWQPFWIHLGPQQLYLFHHLLVALILSSQSFKDCPLKTILSWYLHFAVNGASNRRYRQSPAIVDSAQGSSLPLAEVIGGGVTVQWDLSQVLFFSNRKSESCTFLCLLCI